MESRSMIVSHRVFSWNDIVLRRHIVRGPHFLLKVMESRGVCSEDRLWEQARLWAIVPEWPCVSIALRGHGVIRSGSAAMSMESGDLGLVHRGEDFRARTERDDGFAIFAQWDPAIFGEGSHVPIARQRIAPRDIERLTLLARSVVAHGATHAGLAADVAELFRFFSAQGLLGPPPAAGDITPPPSPRLQSVGRVIDTVMSRAGSRPMVVDLSAMLRCSERQARYLVREYTDAYALQGAREWRALVQVWTTYLAGVLMTAEDATTEGVAAALGYGSPNALCHALTNAGLPSPGEMRRRVAQLA